MQVTRVSSAHPQEEDVTQKSLIMVNFMCQLNWAMGDTDIWSNVILDVSVREFLIEICI